MRGGAEIEGRSDLLRAAEWWRNDWCPYSTHSLNPPLFPFHCLIPGLESLFHSFSLNSLSPIPLAAWSPALNPSFTPLALNPFLRPLTTPYQALPSPPPATPFPTLALLSLIFFLFLRPWISPLSRLPYPIPESLAHSRWFLFSVHKSCPLQ